MLRHAGGFITVKGEPGKLPVVLGLKVSNSSGWRFANLKFLADPKWAVPASTESSMIVTVANSANIILDRSIVANKDDVSDWTAQDWVKKNFGGVRQGGTVSCFTVTNNNIYHVRNSLGMGGSKWRASGNTIHDFGNDGLTFLAVDAVVSFNRITHNRHGPADPLHSDGMQ